MNNTAAKFDYASLPPSSPMLTPRLQILENLNIHTEALKATATYRRIIKKLQLNSLDYLGIVIGENPQVFFHRLMLEIWEIYTKIGHGELLTSEEMVFIFNYMLVDYVNIAGVSGSDRSIREVIVSEDISKIDILNGISNTFPTDKQLNEYEITDVYLRYLVINTILESDLLKTQSLDKSSLLGIYYGKPLEELVSIIAENFLTSLNEIANEFDEIERQRLSIERKGDSELLRIIYNYLEGESEYLGTFPKISFINGRLPLDLKVKTLVEMIISVLKVSENLSDKSEKILEVFDKFIITTIGNSQGLRTSILLSLIKLNYLFEEGSASRLIAILMDSSRPKEIIINCLRYLQFPQKLDLPDDIRQILSEIEEDEKEPIFLILRRILKFLGKINTDIEVTLFREYFGSVYDKKYKPKAKSLMTYSLVEEG